MNTCAVCHDAAEARSRATVTLAGKTVYRLLECPSCALRFLDPLPTQPELEHFYQAPYYGMDWYRQQGKGMASARFVLHGMAPGRFLDVGCNLGFFIDGIRRHTDWEVYGVELGETVVQFAREQLHLEVRRGELADAGFPAGFFNYIHLSNVLEHVRDPLGLLKECNRLMAPGGWLLLSVPNGPVDSLNLINCCKRQNGPALSKDGHLFFFSRQALQLLFSQSGFRIERCRTYGIRRGVRNLGFYPAWRDWRRDYQHREKPHLEKSEIRLAPLRKRPAVYYLFRHLQARVKMLPGMLPFGLDYQILLRPETGCDAPREKP